MRTRSSMVIRFSVITAIVAVLSTLAVLRASVALAHHVELENSFTCDTFEFRADYVGGSSDRYAEIRVNGVLTQTIQLPGSGPDFVDDFLRADRDTAHGHDRRDPVVCPASRDRPTGEHRLSDGGRRQHLHTDGNTYRSDEHAVAKRDHDTLSRTTRHNQQTRRAPPRRLRLRRHRRPSMPHHRRRARLRPRRRGRTHQRQFLRLRRRLEKRRPRSSARWSHCCRPDSPAPAVHRPRRPREGCPTRAADPGMPRLSSASVC